MYILKSKNDDLRLSCGDHNLLLDLWFRRHDDDLLLNLLFSHGLRCGFGYGFSTRKRGRFGPAEIERKSQRVFNILPVVIKDIDLTDVGPKGKPVGKEKLQTGAIVNGRSDSIGDILGIIDRLTTKAGEDKWNKATIRNQVKNAIQAIVTDIG